MVNFRPGQLRGFHGRWVTGGPRHAHKRHGKIGRLLPSGPTVQGAHPGDRAPSHEGSPFTHEQVRQAARAAAIKRSQSSQAAAAHRESAAASRARTAEARARAAEQKAKGPPNKPKEGGQKRGGRRGGGLPGGGGGGGGGALAGLANIGQIATYLHGAPKKKPAAKKPLKKNVPKKPAAAKKPAAHKTAAQKAADAKKKAAAAAAKKKARDLARKKAAAKRAADAARRRAEADARRKAAAAAAARRRGQRLASSVKAPTGKAPTVARVGGAGSKVTPSAEVMARLRQYVAAAK